MLENRLIFLLNTLSRKEMTRFNEFSLSPYFNKHEDTRLLIEYLSDIYPNFNPKNCDRNIICKKLFSKKGFQHKHLALVFTYAVRLLDDFLIQEEFQINEGFPKVLLLRNLRKRGQYKYYDRILDQQEKHIQQSSFQNSEYYNIRFLTAAEANAYHAQLAQHKTDLSIQSKQDNLDYFYLSQKLRDACEMLVRTSILSVEYSTSLLDAVIEDIQSHPENYEHIPAIYVYYKIYQVLLQSELEKYEDVLPYLQKYEHHFPKDELHDIYQYLQHYCIKQLNKGNTNFLRENFRLYQLQLDKDLLIENEALSEWHYKNIVTVGVRLNETDWVVNFIKEYKNKLSPEVRENAYRFNLASYYYAIQEYEKVLDLLLTVEYKDKRYVQGVKALLLRTYYDLGEEESLLSLIESFRIYIKRNKEISMPRKQGFYNLLKYTKRAAQIKNKLEYINRNKLLKQLENLKKAIAHADTIFNHTWLNTKIKELEKSLA